MRRTNPARPLVQRLLDLYQNDPDPGVHAAAEWTLRRCGQDAELAQLDRQMASSAMRGDRLWYVNRQGHTMVVVPGPAQFLMGSPEAAGVTDSDERPHVQRIRRSYSIAGKETTVEQFRRFLDDAASAPGAPAGRLPEQPQTSVTWYEAAAYCNWLSKADGLPEEQWCYLPNPQGQYAAGMKPAPNGLDRRGYRLPTEAEWEYACRAGATSSRSFGDDAGYLRHYAVLAGGSAELPGLVGRKKPNDFGLFDMLGNAAEWCHDRFAPYPGGENGPAAAPDPQAEVLEAEPRVLRGGSFLDAPQRIRSAARDRASPGDRRETVGFRVARSYP
jgi:formylglycine-generating enzyme required for sulfatase activity